jgi:hypothetical protein
MGMDGAIHEVIKIEAFSFVLLLPGDPFGQHATRCGANTSAVHRC